MTVATLEREADADEAVFDIEALTGAPWFPPLVDPAFFDFIKAEGRVPRLGDSRPPYSYKGWLLFQVWMLSGARGIHSRWTHYFETLAAGRLPDRPVPPLNFRPAEDAKGRILKALGKMVEKLGRDHGYGERALNVLIEWVAFALACDSDPEPDIPASTSRWLYEQFDVTQLLSHPHDYLGDMLEQHRGKSKRFQGFFLTHERVCELMTELASADYDGDLRLALVYEPAAGSSRQLLQFSGLSHRLAGQDIDPVCVKISRINGALYAPHLTFPAPDALLFASVLPTEPSTSATDLREGQQFHAAPAPEAAAEPEEAPGGEQPAEYRQSSLFDLL